MKARRSINLSMVLFCGLLFVLSGGREVQAGDAVTWYERDIPPAFILAGSDKGTGFAQRIEAYFLERLDDYDHRVGNAPLARFLAEARDQDGQCSFGLYKGGSRDQVLLYSEPVVWTQTVRIVIRRDSRGKARPYEDAQGEIDLVGLTADDAVWFGVTRDRSYSGVIDRVLANAKGHRTIETSTVFKMLDGKRFHYTFAYPWEAAYHFRVLRSEANYDYLPIQGQKAFLPTFIGCSKGPVGQRLIADVNEIITKGGVYPPWYGFYEEWLGPRERDALRSHLTAIAAQ